jgi:hypothetical protein
MPASMQFELTLKSGAVVRFKASRFEVKGGRWEWDGVIGAYPQLLKINVDDVAAVVRVS